MMTTTINLATVAIIAMMAMTMIVMMMIATPALLLIQAVKPR